MAKQENFSLSPVIKDLKGYSVRRFFEDAWAGLSVSFLSIPQALAFSMVGGLPAFCGIVATVFGTAIAALIGSSKHLVIGPTNASVLLMQATIATVLSKYYPHVERGSGGWGNLEIVLPLVAGLVFFIGVFQLLAATLHFGRVIQFVSQAVVVGYIAGTAVAITLDQLFPFFGINMPAEATSLYEKAVFVLLHLGNYHLPTTVVGVMSISVFLTLERLKFRIPTSLTMLLVVTGLVYALDLHTLQDAHGSVLKTVGEMGAIEGVIPSLRLPLLDIGLLNMFLPTAFAIAVFGMLETTSLSKTVAASSGQRLNTNQDILGLGLSNFLLSFFGSLPCSSSISRTYLNYNSGAKTRFAAVFSSLFVAFMVFFLSSYIGRIPIPALAALIIITGVRVIDIKQVRVILNATHSDAFVLVVTFLSCIFFTPQTAFYVGVVCSIALYLRKAASPEVVEYTYDSETEELRPMPASERNMKKLVRIINIEGELFFGAVDLFQSTLKAIAEDDHETRVFILRLKHVRDFDATACFALKQLHDYLRRNSRHLIVSSLPKKLWGVLEKAKLVEHLGKDNLLVINEHNPYSSIEDALRRAKELLDEGEETSTEEVPAIKFS